MLSHFRLMVIVAGVAVGLTAAAPGAQACHKCKCRSVTYYEPTCSPCGPQVMVPVTVTTRKCGLFGLRTETSVTYGAPVPSVAPVAVQAPVISSYQPVFAPPPGAIIIGR